MAVASPLLLTDRQMDGRDSSLRIRENRLFLTTATAAFIRGSLNPNKFQAHILGAQSTGKGLSPARVDLQTEQSQGVLLTPALCPLMAGRADILGYVL